MKRILGYTLMLLAVGFAFTSCSDDDSITPAPLPTGIQAFFSSDVPSTYEITKAESQFAVPVSRANTTGTVTVAVTAEQEEGSIFSVPASVQFADGEANSEIIITYNPDDLVYGKYETLSLQLDKNASTPYGFASLNIKAGATEWVSMGSGYYREDLFTSWYDVENVVYAVEIEKNIVKDGMYRVVNPYGAAFPYNDPGDWDDSKDYYMVIDATDPDYVWIPSFNTGCDWGKGEFNFLSFVAYYLAKGNTLEAIKSSHPEYFGTLKDGVITLPEPQTMLAARGEDGYYYSNANGMFAVALPGSRIADYSIGYEYLGRFIDLSKQYYVEGVATFGDDVASAKAALVTEETYEGVYDAIVAGTSEDAVDVVDGKTFRLKFDESGTYYVLIVAFNADGEVAGELTSKVKAEIESGESAINWEAQAVGNYYYDIFSDPSKDKYAIDEGLTLSVDPDNGNHYQIAPWGGDGAFALEFFFNEDGSITVPADQATGLSGVKGQLFVADVQTFTDGDAEYADKVCVYDEQKQVFTFCLVYYNDAGEAYLGEDTFTLTDDGGVKAQHISLKRLANLNKAKRATRLAKKAVKVPSL